MINLLFIALEQAALHLPLAVGAYISIGLMKVPDLSLESAFVSGAFFGIQSVYLTQHLPTSIQLVCALLASSFGGACVGLTSSTLTRTLGIAHLLSSILTFGLFHGIIQRIFGAYQSAAALPNPLILPIIHHHPELAIVSTLSLVAACLLYLFCITQLGYACAVFGMNPTFFKRYGISTSYVFMMGIVCANAGAGLSGYLVAQSNSFAELYMGFGKILLCITALILGKALLQPQRPLAFLVPILGICIYFIIQQLLISFGIPVHYFSIIQALIVLSILLLTKTRTNLTTDHLGI